MEEVKRTLVDMSFGTAFKIGAGLALGAVVVMIIPWTIMVIIAVVLAAVGALGTVSGL